MSNELLKPNGETFKERPLTIEEAKKLPDSPVQSSTKTCPSVAINHYPENKRLLKISKPVKMIFQLFQENKHTEMLLFKKQNFQPKRLS